MGQVLLPEAQARVDEMLAPKKAPVPGFGEGTGAVLIRNGQPVIHRGQSIPSYVKTHPDANRFGGVFKYGLFRRKNIDDVNSERYLVQSNVAPNLIVDAGKLHILNTQFNSGTQIVQTNWFAGCISSTSYSSIVAADTLSSHGGWTEFTSYSQSTRPAWSPGSPTNVSGVSITNASPITFNITATGTIKGLFIVGAASGGNTKGGTTGTLWAATLFVGGDVAVVSSDELRCTYTVNM